MRVNHTRLFIIFMVFVSIFVCCVSTGLGEELPKNLDQEGEDVLINHRESREYDREEWHAVLNTPEGSSGWIPRDHIDSQSGVVVMKRRRLRKRKKRPPVVSFVDDSVEDILQPITKIEEKETSDNQNLNPVVSLEGPENESTKPKRRKRPNVREPWEEIQEESVRPYVRRKVTPAYQAPEELVVITSSSINPSSLGDTIQIDSLESSEQNQEPKESHEYDGKSETTQKSTSKRPNIKAILKQNDGLSLSEILQQKNLTLAELLMGNQEALNALAEPSADITAPSTPSVSENIISFTQKSAISSENIEVTKYKRLPPSVALKKDTINRRSGQYGGFHESLSEKELIEAQKKRQALLQGHSYKNAQNGKFSGVTRYEVITEPTTEKRIFVPSHPKLYTSIDYKPEFSKLAEARTEPYLSKEKSTTQRFTTETTTQPPTSTTQKPESTTQYIQSTKLAETSFTKSKFGLPMTSAKLNKLVSKRVLPTKETLSFEEEKDPMGFKPMNINITDILGFLNSYNESEEKQVSDEPLRMEIDLDIMQDKTTSRPCTEPSTTQIILPATSVTSTSDEDILNLKPFSAKDEIQEILKDSEGRERLAKILEARNMTFDELIDQRERGSSQLHLADIFHNKTREPEPLEEAFEGHISSEEFTSFPVFSRHPKSLTGHETTTTEKPIEKSSQIDNVLVTAFPIFKIEVPKDLPKDSNTNEQPFPWRELYPDLFNIQDTDTEKQQATPDIINNQIDLIQPTDVVAEIFTGEDLQRLEELDHRLLSSVASEQLNIIDEEPHRIIKIPSGVQSAIVASLIIVGLSLLVFMTILVVFRWMQKGKSKFKYTDSLTPPLFHVKQRNLRTFVNETLGRTKLNYYKNNMQSMSIWDKNSERKDSF